MRRRFELIVFDWDGTIMDSLGAIVGCAQQSIRDLSLPEVSDEKIRGGIGLGLDVTVERLMPGADPELRRSWIDRYRENWIATFRHQPVMLPGALETVEELDRREYLLAVATGKGRRGLDRDLETTGLGRLFLASRTVDESPSKPSPQMLLELMDELGTRPEQTLMVGDTTYDLDMARNAAVPSVGVLTGSHDRATLMSCGALTCLDSVADLPAWLAGS